MFNFKHILREIHVLLIQSTMKASAVRSTTGTVGDAQPTSPAVPTSSRSSVSSRRLSASGDAPNGVLKQSVSSKSVKSDKEALVGKAKTEYPEGNLQISNVM